VTAHLLANPGQGGVANAAAAGHPGLPLYAHYHGNAQFAAVDYAALAGIMTAELYDGLISEYLWVPVAQLQVRACRLLCRSFGC